jgi:hypothetical protein
MHRLFALLCCYICTVINLIKKGNAKGRSSVSANFLLTSDASSAYATIIRHTTTTTAMLLLLLWVCVWGRKWLVGGWLICFVLFMLGLIAAGQFSAPNFELSRARARKDERAIGAAGRASNLSPLIRFYNYCCCWWLWCVIVLIASP